MLEEVKNACRIKSSAFDSDIAIYMDAAVKELKLAGVKQEVIDQKGNLLKNAVICYVKAYIGTDRDDTEKYLRMFEGLKLKLTYISQEVQSSISPEVQLSE